MASPDTSTARREELLAHGIRMFSERAFDEVSMDDVAAEAGVVKGLLYYYFGSKRGFYVAAVRAAANELRGQWDADEADLEPLDRLRRGLEAYLRHARDHAEGYRTTLAGGVGSDPEVRAILAEEHSLVIDRVVTALGLPAAPPALRVALQGWLSFVEGSTLNWLDERDLGEPELRDLLLGALAGTLAAAHAVDPRVPAALPGS
jgi:AcrR family transcriptional regulator